MDTDKAIELLRDLQAQLAEIESDRNDEKLDAFKRRASMLISQIFTDESVYLLDLNSISFYSNVITIGSDNTAADIRAWKSGWSASNNLIETMIEQLNLEKVSSSNNHHSQENAIAQNTDIFIVHGHNEEMKQSVARTVEKLNLNPIILHELPDRGRTIIEKFSDSSEVGFAIILLSPDDSGYSNKEGSDGLKNRARQNVILELGYFLGKIGRERVIVLHYSNDNFEIPSDYQGVLYVPYDEGGNWKNNLVRELKACGYTIDANKLFE